MEKLRDLNKIVKAIRFRQVRTSRGGYKYTLLLELVNDKSGEMSVDKDDFSLMTLLKEIYGEAIVKKDLVEEFSETNDSTYVCVRIELVDGTVRRYFPSSSFNKIIDLTYNIFQKQNNEEKIDKSSKKVETA